MGPVSTSACWRLLSFVSEHESPREFLAFYQGIKSAAIRAGFSLQTENEPLAEEKIRSQMVEAIGRSLQIRPSTLPAVGHTIMFDGECWHVWLKLTQIPHLSATVLESQTRSEELTKYRFRLVREMIETGEVDYGKIDAEQLHGKTWELYLFCKTRTLRVLTDAFNRLPILKSPVILPPNQVFPELNRVLPNITTLGTDPAAVRKFLDQSDRVLMKHIGESGLAEYLRDASISPKQFLEAQKPSLLERMFKL